MATQLTPDLRPKLSDLEQFFGDLYGDEEGILILWHLPGRVTTPVPAPDWKEAARTAFSLMRQNKNVYFGICLQSEAPTGKGRGGADTAAVMPGLFLDVDIQGEGHKTTGLPLTLDDALALVRWFPLAPTYIIFSGHGIQVYWLFREAWQLVTAADRNQAAGLSRRFQAEMYREGQRRGWKVDQTFDLARVFRVPFTMNLKVMTAPVRVRVLERDVTRRHDPADFELYLEAEKEAPAPIAAMKPGGNGHRPGDDYIRRTTWSQVLEPAGWTMDGTDSKGVTHWIRPGKTKREGEGATTNYKGSDLLYVFSDAAAPFEPQQSYNRFRAYTLLNHQGDYRAAALALSAEGYGDPPIRPPHPALDPGVQSQAEGATAWEAQHTAGAVVRFPVPTMTNAEGAIIPRLASTPEPAPPSVPAGSETPEPAPTGEPPKDTGGDLLHHWCNDAGNAERLIKRHGAHLTYCYEFKKWLAWDGKRWKMDGTKMARKWAKVTMAEYLAAAIAKNSEDHMKYARTSLNAGAIRAMLESAECEIYVEPQELDSDPWLLNCRNGIVDLRTGKLTKHDPAKYITKLVPYDYKPDAECPKFAQFLYRIMGVKEDEERADRLVTYLQRAFGIALTGITSEKVVFIFYGEGDNGKTTLLTIFHQLLRDYAVLLQIETLMASRDDSSNAATADLADLRAARFVMTSETAEGQRLNEAKLKKITQGVTGAPIKTRRLYENPIEFGESHKLFCDANHRPIVRGTDNAIWNRLHLVPFIVTIPKAEQVSDYAGKLLKAEAEGILAWAVQGCIEWQQNGLGKPPEVEKAGRQWRSESDRLADFLEDECVLGEGVEYQVKVTALRAAYEKWCEGAGEKRPMIRQEFNSELIKRGCAQDILYFKEPNKNDRKARGWRGIRLKTYTESEGRE